MGEWERETQNAWDQLTPEERTKWAGNLDVWTGPIDPDAYRVWRDRWRAECARDEWRQPRCGCWMDDCDECGKRLSRGERPREGQRARFTRHLS